MVKRYSLFYPDGNTIKNMVFAGQGAPLFEVEREALEYVSDQGYQFIMVLPVYVSKAVAARQTVNMMKRG